MISNRNGNSSHLTPGLRRLLPMALLLSLTGCFAGTMPVPPPKLALQWDPPARQDKAGPVAVAIVRAGLGREQLGSYRDAPYIASFADSLDADLQRMLIAKGLKLTGPYDDFDGMTFPEKKACDLALVPRIVLDIRESYSQDVDEPGPLRTRSIRRQGQLSAHGQIELTLVEPLSQQKMWVKKVELTGASDTIAVDLLMDETGTLNRFHQNKDNRDTALINMLNESYPRLLDTVWRYLDPEEMSYLANEAKDARARKNY